MKTFEAMDKASAEVIESIADIICLSLDQRELLRAVYELGFKDGQLAALREQVNK